MAVAGELYRRLDRHIGCYRSHLCAGYIDEPHLFSPDGHRCLRQYRLLQYCDDIILFHHIDAGYDLRCANHLQRRHARSIYKHGESVWWGWQLCVSMAVLARWGGVDQYRRCSLAGLCAGVTDCVDLLQADGDGLRNCQCCRYDGAADNGESTAGHYHTTG